MFDWVLNTPLYTFTYWWIQVSDIEICILNIFPVKYIEIKVAASEFKEIS